MSDDDLIPHFMHSLSIISSSLSRLLKDDLMRHQKNIWNEELEFILLVKSYELLKEFPEIQNGDVENCTKLLQFWNNSDRQNEYLSLEVIMYFQLSRTPKTS